MIILSLPAFQLCKRCVKVSLLMVVPPLYLTMHWLVLYSCPPHTYRYILLEPEISSRLALEG